MPRSSYSNFFRPSFIVDHQSADFDNGHQIDWASVGEEYKEDRGGNVVADGTNAQGAVALGVEALAFAIPANTALRFGTDEFAYVTVAAAAGATSLTVQALVNAIEDGDIAVYRGSGYKTLLPGTVMGIASDGTMYPRVASTNPADGLLATHAYENSTTAALSGYGLCIGAIVYENLLPDATGGPPATLAGAIKTELASNTKGFVYRTYSDDRA